MTKFSIIMPSYLGDYPNSATDKEDKLIRAIESVLQQTYKNWELIIIADGCDKTINLLKKYFKTIDKNKEIVLYLVPKQKIWSGVRNFGIQKATGDYIIYLDIDDYYSKDYLFNLSNEITNNDWYFVHDIKLQGNEFKKSYCDIKLGKCGTSNIIHKRKLNIKWAKSDYTEDYRFIQQLKSLSNDYKELTTAGYYVCHIPRKYDI